MASETPLHEQQPFRFQRLHTAFSRHGSALLISGSSQAISSLTSFAVVLFLVRTLDKNAFALYSIGFAASLILSAIFIAFFSTQYLVNRPGHAPGQQTRYAAQYVLATAVSCLGILILSFFLASVPANAILTADFLGLAPASALLMAGFAIKDMATRIAFTEHREWLALISALTAALSALAGFVVTTRLLPGLQAQPALYVIAFSQLCAAALLLLLLRLPWRKLSLDRVRLAYVDAWQGGRWHALSSIVYSLRTQAHNLLVVPILGFSALADINAARILLTPAIFLIAPIYQVAMPRLAGIAKDSPSRVPRYVHLLSAGLLGIALLYSLLLLSTMHWLIPLLLGESYVDLDLLVFSWCLFTLFVATRNGLAMGLEVLKDFKAILKANSIAAIVSIGLVGAMSVFWEGPGAIIALAVAEFSLCVLLYRAFRRCLHSRQPNHPRDAEL